MKERSRGIRAGGTGESRADTSWRSVQAAERRFRRKSEGRALQICKLKGALLNSTHTAEGVQTTSEEVQTCERLLTTARSCEFEGTVLQT